jgi:tetratricopeptide (TPR) repeat protein
MLPDTIQETEGPRRFLPIDYYNRFDVSVNRFDFWKIQDCDDQRVIDLFNDGARLRSQYEFASARYCFEQALRLEPSNIVLVEAMADCYAHENNLKKAIDCLDKAMLIDNSKFELYNNRGLYYYSTYDYQNAMNDYNRAFAIDSTNAILHENLSLLCYQMNKQNESFSEVEKAERFGSNKRRVKEIKTIIGYYNVGELKMKRKPEINKIIESIHKEK